MTATTGVDRLLRLLRKEKDISMSAAADKLGVDKDQLQQWTDFLVENNRVMVHYKFMTPYLTLLDPKGRPNSEDERQTLSTIRTHQKKFITAIKTRDVDTAREEFNAIKNKLDDLQNPDIKADLKQEIVAYPERIKKIGGDAPDLDNKPSKHDSDETTTKKSFKDLFTRVKTASKAGQIQDAKQTLMKIQKKADNTDLNEAMRKQINNKIETAKHHIQTVKQLRKERETT
jgi:ribosomal protein S20